MSFNTINHLFFEKKKKELDADLLDSFNPYVTMRAFTMMNPELSWYINDSLNSYFNIFDTKDDKFKFFENIIPKQKRRKYDYLKKNKKEKVEENSPVPEFYSKREIDILNNLFK